MFDIQYICQQLPHSVVVAAFVAYQGGEWVMGKTRFGSVMGLFLEHPIKTILRLLRSKI